MHYLLVLSVLRCYTILMHTQPTIATGRRVTQDADGNESSKRVGGLVVLIIGIAIVCIGVYRALTVTAILPNLHYAVATGLTMIFAGLGTLGVSGILDAGAKLLSSLKISSKEE